jgi:dephospho-CoA kinase
VGETNKQQPLRIGLTGGIASGKSTVAELFLKLGIPIIDTDVIAREVVAIGSPGIKAVQKRFGDSVTTKSGDLDRAAMRKLIFLDDTARSDLEAILHPRIGTEVRRQAGTIGGPYQIIAVPLLVSSRLLQFIDRVLVVDCEESTQLDRLVKRDAGTIDEAKRIVAAQSSREERLAIADEVVSNDLDLKHLQDQITFLHAAYLNLATY